MFSVAELLGVVSNTNVASNTKMAVSNCKELP